MHRTAEPIEKRLLLVQILISVGFPPFESLTRDEPRQLVGFDVEVACEVAHRLGFKDVQFKQNRFTSFIGALQAGEITPIISDMSITAERQQQVGFAKYNDDTLGMLFNEGIPERFQDTNTVLFELNLLGEEGEPIPIVVTVGSRQFAILNTPNYPGIEPVSFPDLQSALQSLEDPQNGVERLFIDGPTALFFAEGAPEDFVGLNNVIDQFNTVPSQGLAIGINLACCQLCAV